MEKVYVEAFCLPRSVSSALGINTRCRGLHGHINEGSVIPLIQHKLKPDGRTTSRWLSMGARVHLPSSGPVIGAPGALPATETPREFNPFGRPSSPHAGLFGFVTSSTVTHVGFVSLFWFLLFGLTSLLTYTRHDTFSFLQLFLGTRGSSRLSNTDCTYFFSLYSPLLDFTAFHRSLVEHLLTLAYPGFVFIQLYTESA